MKLDLRLDSDRVAAGEVLRGRVTVVEGGPSKSLTLTISFHERSPGYEAVPFSDSEVLRPGDLVTGDTVDFHYALPATAPPSVKSEHGELYWELAVVSSDPGFDTRELRRIEVVLA